MKIIRIDPDKETKCSSGQKMFLDNTSFCCPECNSYSQANFDNMIFRVLEFYCKSCGSCYKISNPAFSDSNKKK